MLPLNNVTRSIFDSVSEEILIISVEDFTIVDANRALLEKVKLKHEDVIGKTCYSVTHHKSIMCTAPNDICPIREMLNTGKPVTVEHTHYDSDGIPFYVEVSASPVKDKKGKITHAVHISRDISDRKRLEKDLLKFRLGVERSDEVIFLTEPDGKIVYVNGMFEKIYGYPKEEVLGETPRILKSGTLSPEIYKNFWETLLAGQVVAGEITNKAKDGRLLTMEGSANPIIDEQSNLLGFLSIQHDITERKRMEEEIKRYSERLEELVEQKVEELRDSEERFRAISSSAMDSIIVSDDEGKVSYWNPAAEQMFGYKQEEVIGKNLHELIAPERSRERYLVALKMFRKTGQGALIGKTVEMMAINRAGLEFPVELSISRFQLGAKRHVAGIIRDITERKHMEKKLRDITYKLGGVSPGGCYVSESLERSLKIFFDLYSHGVHGLAIVRQDPEELVKNYGLKMQDVVVLSSRPLKGFSALSNLQEVSLAISNFLQAGGGVVLLDGLEYLVSLFGFDAVYRLVQEKRFDFLDADALFLIHANLLALGEREKALLTSELKLLTGV